jgi:hypothetical protein
MVLKGASVSKKYFVDRCQPSDEKCFVDWCQSMEKCFVNGCQVIEKMFC